MSTHGVIAKVVGDGWRGVYTNTDSYPTWQGPQIWRTLHETYGGDVPTFIRQCIDAHPQGYSSFPDTCYTQEDSAPEVFYTDRDEDTNEAFFLEWVYVLAPRCLTIFASQRTEETPHSFLSADGSYTYKQPHYRWAFVTQAPIAGDEPDWQAIETLGDALAA